MIVLIPSAVGACLVIAALPAIVVIAAHQLRRRRDYEDVVSETSAVEFNPRTDPVLSGSTHVRSRIFSGLLVAVVIISASAVFHVSRMTQEQKCSGSRLNLRHAALYAPSARRYSLAASANEEAQSLFDVAMIHAFGFDHADALALFESGARADPDCSMCLWGKAYVSGPFINRVS
jgi:hypothetical protein